MTRTRSSGAHAASHRAPPAGSPAEGAPAAAAAQDLQAQDGQARDPRVPDPGASDPGARVPGVPDPPARDWEALDPPARDWDVPDPEARDWEALDPEARDWEVPDPGARDWEALDPGARDWEAQDRQARDPAGPPVGRIWVAQTSASPAGTPGATRARARDGAQLAGELASGGLRHLRARPRVAVALGATLVLFLGLILGWGSPKPPAEPTVQAFLLAWEHGQYQTAASMTTGNQDVVAGQLATAYHELGAADLVLGMAAISQHAATASARFNASVDLGQGGLAWTYQGRFTLRRAGASWKIVWSPAVIVPGLRAGQRLAVVTILPGRAQLLDAAGKSLAQPSLAYVAGVRPGALKHPSTTAGALARATGLPAGQLLSQILAAPSAAFLALVHLRPGAYHRLSRRLRKVPGLIVRQTTTRLFNSVAPAIYGSVGTEMASVLRHAPYQPGTTVGLSGLQQAFQSTLAGTPTIEVAVLDAAGHTAAVLKQWPGHPGTSVQTTIDSATQRAADSAVSSLPQSAAIVAIRPGSGQILAVAQHKARGMPAISALAGRYRPGQAFTIVSTAALLATGFSPSTPTPCNAANTVGGVSFSNDPPEPNLGMQPLFSTDFAHACGTAFAGASLNLNPSELATAASTGFGIGAPWRLPLPYFSGSVQEPTDYAQLAAAFIGTGSVQVSPLDMALAAGVIQSGSWHSPSLVTRPADPGLPPRVLFRGEIFSQLRTLMRSAVRTGAGQPARVAGPDVYGQVGSVPLGPGPHSLQASWFVGFRAGVAFAVLVFSTSPDVAAAHVAGQFVRALKSGA